MKLPRPLLSSAVNLAAEPVLGSGVTFICGVVYQRYGGIDNICIIWYNYTPIMTGADFISRLPVRMARATPEGLALLENNAELQDIVAQYARDGHTPRLEAYPRLGIGARGQVRDVAGLAVKSATRASNGDSFPWRPCDVMHQFTFMDAVNHHLQQRPDQRVHAPDQYLALLTRQGTALHVQQRAPEAITMGSWLRENHVVNYHMREDIRQLTKSRIADAMGTSALRYGLDDLGLRSAEFGSVSNIMVWEGADLADLPEAPIYVIDQPAGTLRSWIGVQAAQRMTEQVVMQQVVAEG